jgi:hypothetical protein
MTSQEQPQNSKPSYTQRLISHLEENKVNKKTIELIKSFSAAQALKIQEERAENAGLMNFGKYKGKHLSEVFKLDLQYCQWLNFSY